MKRQPSKLEGFAFSVALEAPERQNKWAYTAYIPWDLVNDIRAELEELGYDWRAAHRDLRARRKAYSKERAQQAKENT